MEEQKSASKVVVATISALTTAAVFTGAGVGWWMTQKNNPPTAAVPTPIVTTEPNILPTQVPPVVVPLPAVKAPPVAINSPATPAPLPTVIDGQIKPTPSTIAKGNETTVKIWRLDDDGKKTFLVAQDRQVSEETSKDPNVLVKRPLISLLASAGKPDGKLTSTIPVGTKLLSARVQSDGIHINLSKEFTRGFGATSMIGRLGQIVYTATTENPDTPVWISVEGKPLETLGDVGVEIRQPITRQMYDQDFPINPTKSKTP